MQPATVHGYANDRAYEEPKVHAHGAPDQRLGKLSGLGLELVDRMHSQLRRWQQQPHTLCDRACCEWWERLPVAEREYEVQHQQMPYRLRCERVVWLGNMRSDLRLW